jgi:hypothetical protein
MTKDKHRVPVFRVLSESDDTPTGRKLTIAVVEETHANEIPDNIDADLYTTTRPASSSAEFSVDPDSDLAEALRRHGFDA